MVSIRKPAAFYLILCVSFLLEKYAQNIIVLKIKAWIILDFQKILVPVKFIMNLSFIYHDLLFIIYHLSW